MTTANVAKDSVVRASFVSVAHPALPVAPAIPIALVTLETNVRVVSARAALGKKAAPATGMAVANQG